MSTMLEAAEQSALRGLLGALESTSRPHAVDSHWERALWAAPRHAFLPDRIYVGDRLESCLRSVAPAHWLRAAYTDAPVVTQVNDGAEIGPDQERWPSSSSSVPSMVLRMLRMLELCPGHSVLEIGTGTGWNTGLLAHYLGSSNVTTVEVDAALAARAVTNLKGVGLTPTVVCADGAAGVPGRAPYDRIVATCSVRRVPRAWLHQTREGGLILTPWESPWLCFGLLRMTVDRDGGACGRFHPHASFMLMRGQRTDLRIYRDVVQDDHAPEESGTDLSPWAVTGDDWAAQFAIGLQLRDVWHAWHDRPVVDGIASRLWLATTDATSWAAVDWDGHSHERFTVWQHGPRRLWAEVEAAYRWWRGAGRPGPGRFGMTITPDGTHKPWLDRPDRKVPVSGGAPPVWSR
ncbi:methyltransferase domain-containing protein [Streptomyces thermolilacinus]